MVAECPSDDCLHAARVADPHTRANIALSILNHRAHTDETCLLAARALLGDDVIAEAGR
jgi:hypothetical protein